MLKQKLTIINKIEQNITATKQTINRLKAQRKIFKDIQSKKEITPLMKIEGRIYSEQLTLKAQRKILAKTIVEYYNL